MTRCQGVLDSWIPRADAVSLDELRSGRGYIPADIDRALLNDLSARLGVFNIADDVRFLLRDRFWSHAKRVLIAYDAQR